MKRIEYSESLARSIQNWGEQDPRIHNAEMKRWRKRWSLEVKRCALCGEFHDVEDEYAFSGSGHDVIQANTIWECERKQFPDDEAFAS